MPPRFLGFVHSSKTRKTDGSCKLDVTLATLPEGLYGFYNEKAKKAFA
jgi:hypothetical protein